MRQKNIFKLIFALLAVMLAILPFMVSFNDILTRIRTIPVTKDIGTWPKVSIIGDLYMRDNDIFNQQLIRELENYGAEAAIQESFPSLPYNLLNI